MVVDSSWYNSPATFRAETRDCGNGLFAEGTENLRVVVESY